jgi:hypothetical protein
MGVAVKRYILVFAGGVSGAFGYRTYNVDLTRGVDIDIMSLRRWRMP